MTTDESSRSLDGLRAVAAIGAFLYMEGHLRGGFVGIDLFLAVTGFTVTGAVLPRHGTRLSDIATAAGERARAVVGPVVVLLACAALYGAYVATRPELSRLHEEAISGIFLLNNWHAVSDANLLTGPPLVPSFLGHLWVLALVAQAAVVWMLFVVALGGDPAGRRRRLIVAAMSLAALSSITAYYYGSLQDDPARAFFGTDGHATSFLLGAAVAAWSLGGAAERTRADVRWRRSAPQLVAVAAMAFLVWQSTQLHAADPDTYSLPLVAAAVASAVVVWGVTHRLDGALSVVLRWRPLAFVGATVFCAYLLYLPVVAVVDAETTSVEGWWLSVVRAAVLMAGGRMLVVLFRESARATGRTNRGRLRSGPNAPLLVGMAALTLVLAFVTARSPESTSGGGGTRVLVVGDQMAGDVADGLAMSAREHFSVFDRSIDGCGIFSPSRTRVGELTYNVLPECQRWVNTWTSAVAELQPDVAVLSAGEWDATAQELAGQWVEPCDSNYRSHYEQMLGSAVDVLSSQGASVVLITARNADRTDESWVGCVNDIYRSFASSQHDRAVLVDIGGYLCQNGSCSRTIGGRSIVTDNGVDLNDHGKDLVATWLEPRLARAATM